MLRVLTDEDLCARYPGTNRQSWAQRRYTGKAPRFFKVGRKVFYRVEDVLEWEENNLRTSTSKEGITE